MSITVNDGTCLYSGMDTLAELAPNDDDTWRSRCNCLVVTCQSGTYEHATDALISHRANSTT